jgi:hypothetical protein
MQSTIVRRNALLLSLLVAFASPYTAEAGGPADPSTRASTGSILTPSVAAGVLVAGTLSTLQLTGQAVVASVETVADGTVIVLRGASDAGTTSVRVAGAVSVSVGTAVRVVAMSTGCALMAAGQMIAFIPNDVGNSLVHQSRATALRQVDR